MKCADEKKKDLFIFYLGETSTALDSVAAEYEQKKIY